MAATTDPDAQATQHVESLIATSPGERVMLPGYGVGLGDYVFDDRFGAEQAAIANDVQTAMAKWEPTLTLDGVQPVGSAEAGVVSLDVQFSRQPGTASPPVMTATVLVGGTVVQEGQGT